MKKVLSLILCMAIVLYTCGLFADAAVAESERTVTVFPDGSYCITTITVEPSEAVATMASMKTKTATKAQEVYSATNNLLYTAYVRGTFQYDGNTSIATAAQYSYKITDSKWSFVSGSATRTNATAIAVCKFHATIAGDRTATVRLSCAPDGTLS